MSKHTPGPWEIDSSSRILLPSEIRNEERRCLRNWLWLLPGGFCLLYVTAHVLVWWFQ